ncbi:hypothetical protein [Pseudorhodobacter sp. E13]|uniref:hypothetical protein n=1 Tax=Pseudorhodobacter sp. E13 TaxID=2487931 RepID=UPI001F2935EA|nr:hypothetical protein [Pseudorhodobacter sp. E13]
MWCAIVYCHNSQPKPLEEQYQLDEAQPTRFGFADNPCKAMTSMQGNGRLSRDPNPDRRISVAGARRMLGFIGKNYDDDAIAEILETLYGIAEASYEKFMET